MKYLDCVVLTSHDIYVNYTVHTHIMNC